MRYDVPEEIRKTNLVLHAVDPVEVDEAVYAILQEYESIIRVQKEGILRFREDKIRTRKFDAKDSLYHKYLLYSAGFYNWYLPVSGLSG